MGWTYDNATLEFSNPVSSCTSPTKISYVSYTLYLIIPVYLNILMYLKRFNYMGETALKQLQKKSATQNFNKNFRSSALNLFHELARGFAHPEVG